MGLATKKTADLSLLFFYACRKSNVQTGFESAIIMITIVSMISIVIVCVLYL